MKGRKLLFPVTSMSPKSEHAYTTSLSFYQIKQLPERKIKRLEVVAVACCVGVVASGCGDAYFLIQL